MPISSIYIMDQKGRVLIKRAYRADAPLKANEIYEDLILKVDEINFKPILIDKKSQLIFLQKRYNNLTFLMISTKDENVVMAFDYLNQLIKIFLFFFKNLDEETVRDNFVSIYEILEETMDNGYPQLTDPEILSKFLILETLENKGGAKRPTTVVQLNQRDSKSYLNWRAEEKKYDQEICNIFVKEKLDMTLNAQGELIKSQVRGELNLDTELSGVPEITMILNSSEYAQRIGGDDQFSVNLEDKKFHQCVNLEAFEENKILKFIPPHGEFTLMSYTVEMSFFPLFHCSIKQVKNTDTRAEFDVWLSALYHLNTTSNDVKVHIPVPIDTINPEFSTEDGLVNYQPEQNVVVWSIDSVRGESRLFLKVRMNLPTVVSPQRKEYLKLPIRLEFEVPMMTISGINVVHCDVVEPSGSNAFPSVEYTTIAGEFYIRTDSIL